MHLLWFPITLLCAVSLATSDALTKKALAARYNEYLIAWFRLMLMLPLLFALLLAVPTPPLGPEFFRTLQSCVNMAVEGRVEIVLPYGGMKKTEVMRRGVGLPLELTFSCLAPDGDRHCGACNKCAERQAAFRDAGMTDPTRYA